MSDRMPEDMPDRMPEDLPDRMPEDMPEDMPDRMPNRMSEDMSDRMPEDVPVRTCINVMVGITRSKIIYLFILFIYLIIYIHTFKTKKLTIHYHKVNKSAQFVRQSSPALLYTFRIFHSSSRRPRRSSKRWLCSSTAVSLCSCATCRSCAKRLCCWSSSCSWP